MLAARERTRRTFRTKGQVASNHHHPSFPLAVPLDMADQLEDDYIATNEEALSNFGSDADSTDLPAWDEDLDGDVDVRDPNPVAGYKRKAGSDDEDDDGEDEGGNEGVGKQQANGSKGKAPVAGGAGQARDTSGMTAEEKKRDKKRRNKEKFKEKKVRSLFLLAHPGVKSHTQLTAPTGLLDARARSLSVEASARCRRRPPLGRRVWLLLFWPGFRRTTDDGRIVLGIARDASLLTAGSASRALGPRVGRSTTALYVLRFATVRVIPYLLTRLRLRPRAQPHPSSLLARRDLSPLLPSWPSCPSPSQRHRRASRADRTFLSSPRPASGVPTSFANSDSSSPGLPMVGLPRRRRAKARVRPSAGRRRRGQARLRRFVPIVLSRRRRVSISAAFSLTLPPFAMAALC